MSSKRDKLFQEPYKETINFLRVSSMILLSIFLFTSSSGQILVDSNTLMDSSEPYTQSLININPEFQLDNDFIYNLTLALSQIIFTAYDHDLEIPKGRFFGSKGELKAAQILAENMSNIGLFVTKEQIQPRPQISDDTIISLLEVLEYDIVVNGKSIECYPAPSWIQPDASKNMLDTTIDLTALQVKRLPDHPLRYQQELAQETEGFVFITQDPWNDPNGSIPLIDWLQSFLDPLKFYMLFHIASLVKIRTETEFFVKNYPQCKGYVLFDFNDECYDMIFFDSYYKNFLPTIFINGSLGKMIWEKPDDYSLDIYLKQRYNESIESYNVIGQINGTDPTKTMIISSLYDCWWNQGTADSAIGTAIVVAIGKYFMEHNLQPKYTMKFIGFSGEECDIRGAYHYESLHQDEDILYVIDLNQLGFTQNHPSLTLDIVANSWSFLDEIYTTALDTHYYARSGFTTNTKKILMKNIPSNTIAFSLNRKNSNCVSFFKDGGWLLHHRNGQNYTEGDVFKYYNASDVALTGELILNITKQLILDDSTTINKENTSLEIMQQWSYLTSLIKTGPKNAR
jgi:hypothetical protein